MTFSAGQNAPSARKTGRHVSLAEFARMWASDMTVPQIAEELGISRSAVQFRAKRRGLPTRQRIVTFKPRPPRDAFARMWLAGVRLSEIADHFDLTYGLAQKLLREFDLPRRPVGGQRAANRQNLDDYLQAEMRLALAASARAEGAQLRLAEMVDLPSNARRAA